jgi:hypothetical protein
MSFRMKMPRLSTDFSAEPLLDYAADEEETDLQFANPLSPKQINSQSGRSKTQPIAAMPLNWALVLEGPCFIPPPPPQSKSGLSSLKIPRSLPSLTCEAEWAPLLPARDAAAPMAHGRTPRMNTQYLQNQRVSSAEALLEHGPPLWAAHRRTLIPAK